MKLKEIKEINIDEILNLYIDAKWQNYVNNKDMLINAMKNSLYILGAYDNDELIGLIRVIGDGYSIIYIQDIIILNKYQRKGIGTKLITSVLNKYKNVYQKVLLTDNKPKTISFYKSLGFYEACDLNCTSFIIINNN